MSSDGRSRSVVARPWPRREILKTLTGLGVGSAVFGRALVALAEGSTRITVDMIRGAEWVSGLELTGEERELMVEGVNETLNEFARLREISIDNSVPPALHFHPTPVERSDFGPPLRGLARPSAAATAAVSDEDLAFASVAELSLLLRDRRVSSVELTRLYLDRLERYDPVLRCVIRRTEDLALRQAERADREIASGRYRGPLHGVPWGAKDLLSVPGRPTTWGARPYRDRILPDKATVVSRLEAAGAVLLAKLSLGALAWGDVWFGGRTRNPWKPAQGSSGSSAGSAAATAAGLVAFAVGTETWGSIVSPCTRCGATGLRPTFGRVSRHGVMALSWSMDKVGPIARTAEDCALVFDAIHGEDGRDPSAVNRAFEWPPLRDPRSLRVGYVESLFEEDRASGGTDEEKSSVREWQAHDRRTLAVLRDLGVRLVPIRLPGAYPVGSMSFILTAEASAAFDELTRGRVDDELVRQVADAWPNVFRQGQFIPAVEYLRANRVRTLLMEEMEHSLAGVDLYVCPTFGGDNLLLTNLTGHPSVVVPNGFRSSDGTPTSITFVGRPWGEHAVLSMAMTYQSATDFHRRRPPMAS